MIALIMETLIEQATVPLGDALGSTGLFGQGPRLIRQFRTIRIFCLFTTSNGYLEEVHNLLVVSRFQFRKLLNDTPSQSS